MKTKLKKINAWKICSWKSSNWKNLLFNNEKKRKTIWKATENIFWKWNWRNFDILILKFWQIFVKKSLKTAEKPKIGAAHYIILAKCGVEFCIEFVKFSFAAAFHIVFFHNLVNLKKHRLRLWILELKFFEFPALRQYFFVSRKFIQNLANKWKSILS